MKTLLSRLFKVVLWSTALIMVGVILLFAFHPPLVKWAVRKYSPEYTGRQITLDHFRLNPFTGNVHIRGLHVLEAARDTVFLHVDTIDVNTTLYKMLGGSYEVVSFRVSAPFVRIVQHGNLFNFSDLVERFASDTVPSPEPVDTTAVHWALLDLALTGGRVDYLSDLMELPIHVEGLSVTSPGLAWDRDLIETQLALHLRNGARFAADVELVQSTMHYAVHAALDSVPLKIFEPYVAPYMRISKLTGKMDADIDLRGDGHDPMNVGIRGRLGIVQAKLTDPKEVTLMSLGRFEVVIDTADVKNEHYRVRHLIADQPYCLFEMYDDGDNWTRLLATDTSASSLEAEEELGYDPMNPFSMIAYYVELVADSYDAADYRLDSLALVNGAMEFNDYTLQNTFRYKLTDLSVTSTNIDSKRDSITIFAHSALNSTGTFDARMDLDPNSLRNLHFRYDIVDLGMPDFGPYTTFFLAHPVLSGTTLFHNETSIVDNKVHSESHILIEDFQFGRRMDISTAYQMPVRLAVSLLKDKDGNIELDIPVEGDLDDPEYKVMPIVWQVLKNLVVKAVSAPANMLSRMFKVDEEDLSSVRFLYLQEDLTNKQEKPLKTLARVAEAKPELKIELVQSGDRTGEAEAQALLLARKAYLADSTGKPVELPKVELEEAVSLIDIKSPGFKAFLDKKLGPGTDPVQKRCIQLAGEAELRAEVDRLYTARTALIKAWLVQEGGIAPDRIIVREAIPEDKLPANGQPYYQVVYGTAEAD